jgi:hypothetical protein
VLKRLAVLALVAAVTACHGSSSPTDPAASLPHGRLSGTVTIGPNCPGPSTTTQACPTPPEAYAARKILVYDATKTKLLFTVDIDSQGLYTIMLVPGMYTIDFSGSTADRTSDLPKVVTIVANGTVVLNVNIDTGIR